MPSSAKIKSKLRKYGPYFLLAIVLISLGAFYASRGDEKGDKSSVETYSALTEEIKAGKIKSLKFFPEKLAVEATPKKGEPSTIGVPSNLSEGFAPLVALAQKNGVEVSSKPASGSSLAQSLLRVLPTLMLLAIILAVVGIQFGWWNRSRVEAASTGVNFSDVAGCGEAVEELQDVRAFLRDPKKFERLGARVPKGVLLYGPPGTGKTLLAKAVASEANIPFYSSSGSEFVEMFAGLGARRVRQLFQQAKKTAPSIIFIDELDAVGGHRTSGGDGASREADQTLIQILKEIDGFEVSKNPVIVIGATNRVDFLDRALIRPGRFDRHISIDAPDKEGRLEVLRVHAKDKTMSSNVNLESLATQTSGMTGADLSLILNEAALLAARRSAQSIEQIDIDDAYFRVVAGAKKQSRAFSKREREWISIHECGHAVVGEMLQGSDKLHKISIVPRGQSGGQTLYISEEDIFLYSEKQLRDKICGLLAGRAAEAVVLGEISAGASDDLKRASGIAEKMIATLGMGNDLRAAEETGSLSPEKREKIDAEIEYILQEEYERARSLIEKHKKEVLLLSENLLETETLDREEFLQIIKPDKS